MRRYHLGFAAAILLAFAIPFGVYPVFAQGADLSGTVSSDREGAMEGVLVSARKDGSGVTVTVVSDDKGHFSFPAEKLDPGKYTLRIRAAGYELDGSPSLNLGVSSTHDIRLKAARNISTQLTNAEWLMSLPGDDSVKRALYNCTSCHTFERILKSNYTAEDFMTTIFPRMAGYSSQAFPLMPQRRFVPRDIQRVFTPQVAKLADYLGAHNLNSNASWNFELKTMPRPNGAATRVVMTEYDLPRKSIQPHDVVLDDKGTVWFSDFGENILGRMDQKTGDVKEFAYPSTREDGYASGNLDIEFDRAGNIYLGRMNQTGFAKFDPKTETFELTPLPKSMMNQSTQQAMVVPNNSHVDGKVWLNDAETIQVTRYDTKTNTFEPWIKPYEGFPRGPAHSLYGIYSDSQNNAWFCDFSGESIGRIDAKTLKVTLYPTPTKSSRPRRGRMDDQDRFWFAEWFGDRVGMFDTRTETFKEWKIPVPYAAPYDVVADKTDHVWAAGMTTDRVSRINTKTGDAVEYLLPSSTNARRTFVDNSVNPPAFWVGGNHTASIIKVEPLD